MSLGSGAPGGTLGMASGTFIALAATTFGSVLLYSIRGFGFAVVAGPLFPLLLDPARAIQLDGAIDHCALGVVAGYRAVAAASLGARQSCWATTRPASSPSIIPIRSWCGRPGTMIFGFAILAGRGIPLEIDALARS
jgi:hypothetical protein